MKLSVVIPYCDTPQLTTEVLNLLLEVSSPETEIVLINNSSEEKLVEDGSDVKEVMLEKNIGNYPVFFEALKHTDADILCFIHSDIFIHERNWDKRLLTVFEKNPQLGLVGFIGSDEIDELGGRGLGTASNFAGKTVNGYTGSKAEVHGKRLLGYMDAVVVDGCVMAFRRTVLEQIKFRPDFPIHHFYDRLLSCEVLERGFNVGVLGIEFDHISGQTANSSTKYFEASKEHLISHGHIKSNFAMNIDSLIKAFKIDEATYKIAEKMFLEEYKMKKRFIPRKVHPSVS